MSALYSAQRIRESVAAFAVGKAISAPLSLALVFGLAACMDAREYARYVASTALLELALVLGTLGVEWVIQTAVSGVMVYGNAAQRRRMVRILAGVPFMTYGVLALGLWAGAPLVAQILGGVTSTELVQLYSVVLVIEGPLRMLRDGLLPALMRHRAAQAATVARIGVLAGGVGLAVGAHSTLSAEWVAYAEIAASAVALVMVLGSVGRAIQNERPEGPMSDSLRPWLHRRTLRFAAHAYSSLLMMSMLGTDVMIAVVAHSLGAEVTAVLGFVVRLLETARRYLPMDLFWGVLRPAVVGRYESHGRDAAGLMRDCNRMLECNGLALSLGSVAVLAGGASFWAWLGRGASDTSNGLLVVMLPLLATHSVRRTVELLAYVRGHSAAFVRAGMLGVLAPLLCALALYQTGSVYLAPLSVLAVDALLCTKAVRNLRAAGEVVQFHGRLWWRLGLVSVGAAALGMGVQALWSGALGALMAMGLSVAALLMAVWHVPILAQEDRDALRTWWQARRARPVVGRSINPKGVDV